MGVEGEENAEEEEEEGTAEEESVTIIWGGGEVVVEEEEVDEALGEVVIVVEAEIGLRAGWREGSLWFLMARRKREKAAE